MENVTQSCSCLVWEVLFGCSSCRTASDATDYSLDSSFGQDKPLQCAFGGKEWRLQTHVGHAPKSANISELG